MRNQTYFYKQVGKIIKDAREAACLSSEGLAFLNGISPKQLERYEDGIVKIPLEKFVTITEILKIDMDKALAGIVSDEEYLKGMRFE